MSLVSSLLYGSVHSYEDAFKAKDCTSQAMRRAISDWFAMYFQGAPNDQSDPCQRIPYTVVNKLTKTVFGEYNASSGNSFAAGVLNSLGRCKQEAMQMALVGGLCCLKPIPEGEGWRWTVVSRPNLLIFARDGSGNPIDVGTVERSARGSHYYTLLERRTVGRDGRLTITNQLYRAQSSGQVGAPCSLKELPQYEALAPSYTYAAPLGGIGMVPLRTPMVNCVDGSPDPVSVYAPAVGLIHSIDRNEAQLNGEFERGESRIITSGDMLRRDPETGKRRLADHVFVGLDEDAEAVGVTIFSPALREQSFLARKQEYLRNVESLIGLKRGLLSEVEAAQRTATEITSSAGDYNLTIMDFQGMWETAVREAVGVCETLGRLYNRYSGPAIDPDKDVTISWGNGILYDEERAWADYKAMVAAGLLKPELAVGWYFDQPTDTEADLARIRKKYMPVMDSLMGDGDA